MRRATVSAIVTAAFLASGGAPPVAAQSVNGQILYVSYAGGRSVNDIWVINPDGTFATNLTKSKNLAEQEAAYSPDGSRIVFTAFENPGPFDTDIYVVNADGSGRTRLTTTAADERDPVFSPSGDQIAYLRNDEVWVMNADGTSPHPLSQEYYFGPGLSWRPDGNAIAVSVEVEDGSYQIAELTLDGGITVLTTSPGFNYYYSPQYAPDGSRIAYLGMGASGRQVTFVVDETGENSSEVPNSEGSEAVAWAPDGSKLLYSIWRNHEVAIVASSVSGEAAHVVTNESSSTLAWRQCAGDCRLTTIQPSWVAIRRPFTTRRGLKIPAEVIPAHTGETVEFDLFKLTDRGRRKLGSATAKIEEDGIARALFEHRVRTGKCRAVATFAGDEDHTGSSRTRDFRCSAPLS